ncbi:hypothetical protein F4561_006339 [Lipingzhangella halophila]|uniref:Uncharacterized protein n=1 Tax=Lipingzhangella halophila TaxID=1783352 RepID=A0A7W7W719_9ACTN|nr:hypothetical protein [Lipingzhangella halophila]
MRPRRPLSGNQGRALEWAAVRDGVGDGFVDRFAGKGPYLFGSEVQRTRGQEPDQTDVRRTGGSAMGGGDPERAVPLLEQAV